MAAQPDVLGAALTYPWVSHLLTKATVETKRTLELSLENLEERRGVKGAPPRAPAILRRNSPLYVSSPTPTPVMEDEIRIKSLFEEDRQVQTGTSLPC